MADNFSSGSKLTFKINYKVLTAPMSTLSLSFEFQYLENTFGATKAPTVRSLSDEFISLIVAKLLPILGKNVQIPT